MTPNKIAAMLRQGYPMNRVRGGSIEIIAALLAHQNQHTTLTEGELVDALDAMEERLPREFLSESEALILILAGSEAPKPIKQKAKPKAKPTLNQAQRRRKMFQPKVMP